MRLTLVKLPQKSAPAGGGSCHCSVSVAGALVPIALVAVTVYVALPVVAREARQVLPPSGVQPVHWYDEGDCVHDAVSVAEPPA